MLRRRKRPLRKPLRVAICGLTCAAFVLQTLGWEHGRPVAVAFGAEREAGSAESEPPGSARAGSPETEPVKRESEKSEPPNAGSTAAVSPTAAPLTSLSDLADKCRVDNEEAFHGRIAAIARASLEKALKKVDFAILINEQWRKHKLGPLIDAQVDRSIRQVRSETAWNKLIATLTNKEKAEQIAIAVATRVYRSDAFKKAVEALATDVGREVAATMELGAVDAALPAVRCVRAYVGSRYGAGIARMVGDDAMRAFELPNGGPVAQVGRGQIIVAGGEAIAGAVVLLIRRTAARMARRIGQRVVGAVLSRLVSVVAGGIGVVLIAKDVWELRYGVLPIIAEEMKSESAKQTVKAELTKAIEEQMSAHVDELATRTADRILEVWREFREAHTKVVELAAKHPPFKAFLASVGREQLPRVDRIVQIVLAKEGEAGVRSRLRDGTLDEAVKRMPDTALEIAADTGSLGAALEWRQLAGKRLDEVVRYEIHRLVRPAELTRAGLETLLALDDRLAIVRLARLDSERRLVLLALPEERLLKLARALSHAELAALSDYLQALGQEGRGQFVAAIADNPHKMRLLADSSVRNSVLASTDQEAALEMMLRANGPLGLLAMAGDVRLAIDGRISPRLIWIKYPRAVIAAGILALVVLMIFNRLLFGGRHRRRRERQA